MVFERIKRALSDSMEAGGVDSEYIEIDVGREKKEQKILVKLFTLKHYDEIGNILNTLRDGYTIAVIDIKILRQKDSIELKRAISKLKKTTDAIEGSIAGFGENLVIVTPSFASILKEVPKPKEEKKSKFEDL
ncbi:cell division protein SepF [Candidatus Pacearchaeota archaeon]|nr:cell division protein SepF [Candidatus Pacearchaeota archaeon]